MKGTLKKIEPGKATRLTGFALRFLDSQEQMRVALLLKKSLQRVQTYVRDNEPNGEMNLLTVVTHLVDVTGKPVEMLYENCEVK